MNSPFIEGAMAVKFQQSDTIHADSWFKTLSLLYSSLNITKIIQSLNLTDAIIDDSNAKAHLDS